MRSAMRAVVLALVVVCGGCAQMGSSPRPTAPPPIPPQAQWTLEQIPPAMDSPPAPRPTTQPDVPAPVESLSLFAASRDEMIDGHPAEAIGLLKRAIELDPDSFNLYRAL